MTDSFVFPPKSPLKREIAAGLARRGTRAAGVRVSITPRAVWFRPRGKKGKVRVKWLCWNLVSKNGHNVTRPALRVVHGALRQGTIRKALRHWFPKHRCVVDNDIHIT